jgi:hypothetical protein
MNIAVAAVSIYQQLVGHVPDAGAVRQLDLVTSRVLVIRDEKLGRLIDSRIMAEFEFEDAPFDIERKLD